jgi:MFS family permease
MFTPLWYIQGFAAKVGIPKANAFWLLAIINAGSLPGRVLPGFYADRVGAFNVMVPCACMTGILLFMWYVITTPTGIYIFAAMYGFFQGAMISLQAASTASICKDLREIGTMIGMSSAVCSIAYAPSSDLRWQS